MAHSRTVKVEESNEYKEFALQYLTTMRHVLLAFLWVSMLRIASAQTANPFGLDSQFMADLVVTQDKAAPLAEKLYADRGMLRIKATLKGQTMVTLVRPDLQKGYQVYPVKERMLEIPLIPNRIKEQMFTAIGGGTAASLGTEAIEGVSCEKFKVTVQGDKESYIFWRNSKTKVPIRIEPSDHSFSIVWKNYQAGPQPASLFKVPTGYSLIKSPIASISGT